MAVTPFFIRTGLTDIAAGFILLLRSGLLRKSFVFLIKISGEDWFRQQLDSPVSQK